MKLTKKECLKAYSELQTYEYELFGQQEMIHSNVFLSLINEHFKNTPMNRLLKIKDDALYQACEHIMDVTMSCPYSKYGMENKNCESNCVGNNIETSCWKAMYEKQAKERIKKNMI